MGDTFKEVEAGLELAARWLPRLLGIFGVLRGSGRSQDEAVKMIDDHLEVGKPNIRELED